MDNTSGIKDKILYLEDGTGNTTNEEQNTRKGDPKLSLLCCM